MTEILALSQLLMQALGLASKAIDQHGSADDKNAFRELIQKANADLNETFVRSAANDAAADAALKDRFRP